MDFIDKNEYSTKIRPSSIQNPINNSTRLVILPNCNAENRCKNWLGPLNGETRRGCGINVLKFMSEIDELNANRGLKHAIEKGIGTPFSFIVDWFNLKLKNTGLSKNGEFIITENSGSIGSKTKLTEFFKMLEYNLTPNSCTIVKLNRDPDPKKRGNLTPGHYVLISKDNKGEIWTYDPLLSTPNNCERKKYKGVSDNFFTAYKNQGYISVSLLALNQTRITVPMDIVTEEERITIPTDAVSEKDRITVPMDVVNEEEIFLMPVNIMNEFIETISDCNKGGKIIRKRITNKKKNKIRKVSSKKK